MPKATFIESAIYKHTDENCLQVAIMTPEGGLWGYSYIEISPYR